MSEEIIIKKAEFNPKTSYYWLLSGTIILTVTIVGIPFLLLWLPLGILITRRYLDRMECTLTNKTLKVGKGILTRVEKTIPLEKITDMGMVQGPIMRGMDLHKLTVETAGQSGPGALVALLGIVDAIEFREAVLKQRDALASSGGPGPEPASADPALPTQLGLLTEIRDSLRRLEDKLG